jgi:signal recognition particle subunit SRP54
VKEVTGAPILFIGMGETTDKLEPFRPEGMASRVLGMGDVVGLMKDFEEVVDQKQAEQDATRMMSGNFTLDDFLNQIRMIQKMGSLRDVMDKIPGMGAMLPPGAAEQIDDGELSRVESIIQSMTLGERNDAHALVREPSRVRRIARGSGQTEQAVSELVQKFLFMRQMLGGMGNDLGFLGNIPGLKNLAMARNLRRKMGSGQMPGLPPGMGFPGMGMPGMGMPGVGAEAPRMRVLSKSEKNARKNSRKRERDARKKNKGR